MNILKIEHSCRLSFNIKNCECFVNCYLTLTKVKIMLPRRKAYLKSCPHKESQYIHICRYILNMVKM